MAAKSKRKLPFPKTAYGTAMEKHGTKLREALTPQKTASDVIAVLEEMYLDALPAHFAGDISFETIIAAVSRACKAYRDADDRYTGENVPYDHHRVVSVFPGAVVYCGEDGKLYQVAYSMNGTNATIEGETVEVTAEFKAVAEGQLSEAVALIEAKPAGTIKTGRINRTLGVIENVTMIGAISKNGQNKKRRYAEQSLRKIAEMAEGLPGFINHVKPEDAFKPRDIREAAVRHRNVRYDPATQTVRSDMHVAPHHADLVFGLAETFGDHIGNSLVSKGLISMEGDTEVVQDILQLRSADLVSDPATTKGLFEGQGQEGGTDITILVEAVERALGQHKEEPVDLAAMLTHLKDKPQEQKMLAEHFGFITKAEAVKLEESAQTVKKDLETVSKERDGLKGTIATLTTEKEKVEKDLKESKVKIDGFEAKEALAQKKVKLQEAIGGHKLAKEFGKIKGAVSETFMGTLMEADEKDWVKLLDDRYESLKGVPAGQQPKSGGKDLSEGTEDDPEKQLPAHERLRRAVSY